GLDRRVIAHRRRKRQTALVYRDARELPAAQHLRSQSVRVVQDGLAGTDRKFHRMTQGEDVSPVERRYAAIELIVQHQPETIVDRLGKDVTAEEGDAMRKPLRCLQFERIVVRIASGRSLRNGLRDSERVIQWTARIERSGPWNRLIQRANATLVLADV